jgi:hypothetical protein
VVPVDATSARMRQLTDLERAVQEQQPDLRLVMEGASPSFRGCFQLANDGVVFDRFAVRITFPDGAFKLPQIEEIGGRIPRHIDRHVFGNGAICTEVPELTLLRGRYSLASYLDGPVRNYFLGQILVEQGQKWPFGEWDHGRPGLLQAYGEIVGVTDEAQIRGFLDCLGHKKVKGHWNCPCGSGKRIRDCHVTKVRQLQDVVSPSIARQSLARLNMYRRR